MKAGRSEMGVLQIEYSSGGSGSKFEEEERERVEYALEIDSKLSRCLKLPKIVYPLTLSLAFHKFLPCSNMQSFARNTTLTSSAHVPNQQYQLPKPAAETSIGGPLPIPVPM